MATVLLVFIYVIFIGLGLPDSVLGSAWPGMYLDIGATVGQANYITIVASVCTAVMSYFSARIINKFGTGKVTAVSTLLTALGLIGTALSNSLWFSVLCAVPAGLGAGAIDSALNNYVAVHYKASHMNFLHSFYGVGVVLSPLLISLVIERINGWRIGYLLVFSFQVVITVCSFIALPLWNKANNFKQECEEKFTPRTLSFKQMAKMPAVRTAWVVFFSTCALEFTCGIWGATYLVKTIGLGEGTSAGYVTLYYLGIAFSRMVCGIFSKKIRERSIVFTGFTIVGVAITLLILPIPPIFKGLGLLLVGIGNGPTFPNLTCLTPKYFGKEVSQSIIGTQMVACNIGICLMPPLFGVFADYVSVSSYPYYLLVMFILMVVSTIVYDKQTAKYR